MSMKKKKGLESESSQQPEEGGTQPAPVESAPPSAPADSGAESPDQAAGAETPVDPVPILEARVAELEGALAEARDQLLRRIADFDNTRKRLLRDKEESVKYANTALLTDLVESMDGLERAIASAETSKDFEALHRGVVLIEKQLVGSLDRKWGLTRLVAKGQPFDPERHQAVSVGASADGDVPVVLEELESGYLLHERVLRPAKVIVSAPRKAGEAGAGASAPDAGG